MNNLQSLIGSNELKQSALNTVTGHSMYDLEEGGAKLRESERDRARESERERTREKENGENKVSGHTLFAREQIPEKAKIFYEENIEPYDWYHTFPEGQSYGDADAYAPTGWNIGNRILLRIKTSRSPELQAALAKMDNLAFAASPTRSHSLHNKTYEYTRRKRGISNPSIFANKMRRESYKNEAGLDDLDRDLIENSAYQYYSPKMVLEWMLGNLKDNLPSKFFSPIPLTVVKNDLDRIQEGYFVDIHPKKTNQKKVMNALENGCVTFANGIVKCVNKMRGRNGGGRSKKFRRRKRKKNFTRKCHKRKKNFRRTRRKRHKKKRKKSRRQ